MQPTVTLLLMAIRLSGVIQVGLGVLLWTGNAITLIPLEIVLGYLVVVGLWVMAGLAARAGSQRRLVALAVAWGLFAAVLGVAQMWLLPLLGEYHWVMHLLLLLLIVVALVLAELLRRGMRARPISVGSAKNRSREQATA